MPADFNGYWKMVSNDNFEEYLKALDVNVAVRKIANLLKPDKEILQNGDHVIIKTLSTFRNYIMEFDVGKEFEEDLSGVDDRKCMVPLLHKWNPQLLISFRAGFGIKALLPEKQPTFQYMELQEEYPTGCRCDEIKGVSGWRADKAAYGCIPLGAASCAKAIGSHHLAELPLKATVDFVCDINTTVSWDGDKLLCVQNGEKEGRGWTQWIEGDEMHLEIRVCGVTCKQVFKKVQ